MRKSRTVCNPVYVHIGLNALLTQCVEPVDENLKRKVERLEREVEETKAKVEDARASWPDLQRRCLNAVTVQIPEENECTEEDGPPSDAEIPPSQIQDLRKWSKGALSKRAELNLEAMTSIEEKTDQVQTAITSYASAVSSDGKGSGTPERTIEIADTPPSTPLSAARAAREAFAKRGLSLPAFSPNVTPRSRRVRRTLSASRRISSLR